MLIDALFFFVGTIHVLIAPFTKVEESFNLHATHDILMYGILPAGLKNYDHFIFPGVVPRSFVGSITLAYFSTPVLLLLQALGLLRTKFDIQLTVRLILATANACGLVSVRRAVSSRFGSREGLWFALLTCTQFHLPFWMGRTLPNMFAMLPVNLATSLLVGTSRRRARTDRFAICIVVATTVILRAELVLYLAPLFIIASIKHRSSIWALIVAGISSGLIAIATTMIIDSYFWSKPFMWPELRAIQFNVYEGKSAEWGVSSRHAYFTAHLPKLLMAGGPLAVLGILFDRRARYIVCPAVVFIGLISQLDHKEWRFIVYTVPIFNIAAARGAVWILDRRGDWRALRHILTIALFGFLIADSGMAVFMASASRLNYPGGEAMVKLHTIVAAPRAGVFIDDRAAQSGASLFMQERSCPVGRFTIAPPVDCHWHYFKTWPGDFTITHSIIEPSDYKGENVLQIIRSIDRVEFQPHGAHLGSWQPVLPTMTMKDALWIVAA